MISLAHNAEVPEVAIPAGDVTLRGNLAMKPGDRGLVLFAHGSGSSRLSGRNRYVARMLEDAGFSTLLFDLLTTDEERVDQVTLASRFDIAMLARRLGAVTDWISARAEARHVAVGYFGASTGAAAALIAAAERPQIVAAVVSRGGRPDLAARALRNVKAPTLLIVGSLDVPVIAMNQRALDALTAEKKLEIVPGASHLFEEPGTLELVAHLASEWFRRHLRAARASASVYPHGG
jgi:putative phosphoribosyl transferase